jgi:N-acyl-D-aspartate/D-glutamate deacylase
MGNCGFTLAPCAKEDRHLVIRNLERAEDIAAEAMEAGIDWRWTTFPEFLDTLDSLPKGINYSGYIGHSALRTYVMGERAFDGPANEADLAGMERELRNALMAAPSASPRRGRPATRHLTCRAASRMAPGGGCLRGAMGELNAGIFELAGEGVDRKVDHPDLPDYHKRLKALAVETGRPITFGLFTRKDAPDMWRHYVKLIEETNAAGGRMFAQVHSRALSVVLSFKTQLPFDRLPVWKELRALPLGEQQTRLRDPELRKKLVEASRERDTRKALGTGVRQAATTASSMDQVDPPHVGRRYRARARGRPGRGHDRSGAREGPRSLLPPAHRQREPGPRARADQAPAHGRDLLGLGRPRLAAHGRLAPDASAQPLGAREAGADARAGGAHADVRHGHSLGFGGPGSDP